MNLLLANPRGFCAGVQRAVEIVELALERHGAPVYVLHEIVHNRRVLEDLTARGARFVERLDEIPPGSLAIFSAHGVSDAIESEAAARSLRVIDATCPLVTKVHLETRRHAREGRELILVGHAGHPEIEGTRGRHPGRTQVVSTVEEVERLVVADPLRLAYVTQTTLSLDDARAIVAALERRFPQIEGPALGDICYATQNRQNAVHAMLGSIDVLIVVGSANSSNSLRLREIGERAGIPSYLVDEASALRSEWIAGRSNVGLSAGASAPENLVREVAERLRGLGVRTLVELEGEPESTVFKLPAELHALGV